MTLTATKTSMYNLCGIFCVMSKLKDAQFSKLQRHRSYWLEFRGLNGEYHRFYLSPCGGVPLLRDTWTDAQGEKHDVVHRLTVDQLRELSMIQE